MSGAKKVFNKIFALYKIIKPFSYSQRLTMFLTDTISADSELSGWFKKDTGELLEGFKISPEDIVIDVGCGDSPFVDFCAMQGADVICVDVNAQKIDDLVKRLKNSKARSVTGYVSDAHPLPVEDASVTKVIAMEVLEHVDDPTGFLKELVRVGKPGAKYLITVPDAAGESIHKELAPPEYFEKPNHVRIIDRDEFEKLVTDAGLMIEQHKYYGFYWSIWWILFWACNQEHTPPPWNTLLDNWTRTWRLLLDTKDGPKIKHALDNFMPKSQGIIAMKPDD